MCMLLVTLTHTYVEGVITASTRRGVDQLNQEIVMLDRREEIVIPFWPSSYSPPANCHLHQPIRSKNILTFSVWDSFTYQQIRTNALYSDLYDSKCRFKVWVGFSNSLELLSTPLNNVTVNEMETKNIFNHSTHSAFIAYFINSSILYVHYLPLTGQNFSLNEHRTHPICNV